MYPQSYQQTPPQPDDYTGVPQTKEMSFFSRLKNNLLSSPAQSLPCPAQEPPPEQLDKPCERTPHQSAH